MPSSHTRLQIVTDALTISGRGVELKTLANDMLNRMLRQWALEYKYPCLRKTGSVLTLAQGATTVAAPSDVGAGFDNILFGDERIPIYEKSMDDFVYLGGFRPTNCGTGRPWFYIYEDQGNLVRFNNVSDQAYGMIPIYYYMPADLATDNTGDSSTLWMPNDELILQGLVEKIYQYKDDDRAEAQAAKVMGIMESYKRGATPVGGGQPKVQLSRSVFRRRRF